MFKKTVLLLTVIFLPFFSQPAIANSHANSLKNLGMNDIMFAQGMIPHHQQAIEMSNSALKNSASSEIKALAKGIILAQRKEIAQMKYWIASSKASMSMGHDMGANGMLSKKQVKDLEKLKGSKFDKSFLEAMIAHHKGAIDMASMLNGSKNAEAKKLAKDIVLAQSGEITKMTNLLAKISQKSEKS